MLKPCAGTTRPHGSEEAVGTAMRPPLSDDHGRLKARLRPMRGLKQLSSVRVISLGHAFIQNVRRGHYELATDVETRLRLVTAFAELAPAI
jgi:IS6 family transposase